MRGSRSWITARAARDREAPVTRSHAEQPSADARYRKQCRKPTNDRMSAWVDRAQELEIMAEVVAAAFAAVRALEHHGAEQHPSGARAAIAVLVVKRLARVVVQPRAQTVRR